MSSARDIAGNSKSNDTLPKVQLVATPLEDSNPTTSSKPRKLLSDEAEKYVDAMLTRPDGTKGIPPLTPTPATQLDALFPGPEPETLRELKEEINHLLTMVAHLEEECRNVQRYGKVRGWGNTRACKMINHFEDDFDYFDDFGSDGDDDDEDYEYECKELRADLQDLRKQVKAREQDLAKLVGQKKGKKGPVDVDSVYLTDDEEEDEEEDDEDGDDDEEEAEPSGRAEKKRKL
ncbi:hypothetical protein L198_02924 [Cryptococcus wingfieldii CBS 7118]|uniref:Uncharacterized protein n=1 Tax=Cryptococcus wingfieldii CBS 7118 TaxID=1295528 RepID=A0A1E3JI92_9TREE|nr:hypothetical protein L198_02924 [Cryptococcus wingfieldii CBS 7118]ODO00604.1 hypothetical protein L198_02924 [Cryptococcus wingfieldii CBS 7118]